MRRSPSCGPRRMSARLLGASVAVLRWSGVLLCAAMFLSCGDKDGQDSASANTCDPVCQPCPDSWHLRAWCDSTGQVWSCQSTNAATCSNYPGREDLYVWEPVGKPCDCYDADGYILDDCWWDR